MCCAAIKCNHNIIVLVPVSGPLLRREEQSLFECWTRAGPAAGEVPSPGSAAAAAGSAAPPGGCVHAGTCSRTG